MLEPGGYRVDVGASSGDLRLGTEVVLGGAPPVLPLDRHSSIGEWLEHPVGRDVLLEALRAAPGGDLTPLFANPEQLRTIASFPLPRLMTMMGGDLGDGGSTPSSRRSTTRSPLLPDHAGGVGAAPAGETGRGSRWGP